MRNVSNLILLAAGIAATVSAGPVYDIVAGFSNASNPNGVWSYSYGNGTNPVLFSQPVTNQGQQEWYNGGGQPDSITILQNISGGTITGSTVSIPNGYLNLDPEEFTVAVEFTAPSAGSYTINGNFLGNDTNELSHPVQILDNGTSIYSNTIAAFQQAGAFNLTESLNIGDTIEFLVSSPVPGSAWTNLSTGLQGTITSNSAVPEPGTGGLMAIALGLAGAAFLYRGRLG
jgi:hypothetical protein